MLLQSFRKAAGLTQAEVAAKLGVTQQTLSALERNAETVSAGRLMKLLAIMNVEFVLRKRDDQQSQAAQAAQANQASEW